MPKQPTKKRRKTALDTHENPSLPNPEILTDNRDFAALESEWNELYSDAPKATPFQSWAWLYSWWENYGEGNYELRLVVLRDDSGLIVGLMPMMLGNEKGLEKLPEKLLFVGSGESEYLDVISRGGHEAEVAAAAAKILRSLGPWRVADLQQLHPEALAWSVFREWPGPKAKVFQEVCPVIEADPWEELLAPLSKNLRSMARRSVRRADSDGLATELADNDRASEAAERFMELHREMWRGRDIAPEHTTERFESHIKAAVRRMASAGTGGVSEFWRDGEVVASHVVVFGKSSVGLYLSGATREALDRYQMSSLFVHDGVNLARGRGLPRFDFLRGEDPYKLRWNPQIVENHRAILGKNPFFWAPYAAFHALREKLRRYANSGNAPAWVEGAKARYKSFIRGG